MTENSKEDDKQSNNKKDSKNPLYKYDCDFLDDEDENRSASEKIKDYISDNSDKLGCLLSLIVVGGVSLLGVKGYHYLKNQEYNRNMQAHILQQKAKQASIDAPLIETEYLKTLLQFTNQITNENAPRVFKAVKDIVLIQNPEKSDALDLLNQQYLNLYQKEPDKFQERLLERLSHKEQEEKAKKTPLTISVSKSIHPYIKFKFCPINEHE